ncbi:Putative polysaccharide export protein [Desulfonema limicola]|uniref:Polysaccharide export protein n=1 Tax=Desulfonema limicola TaxID=45656 RepID=A0A975GFE6_9BACT|nr:polysaccharide biosynthesis/export family protein [Desulfonema limicola]QTA79094.1 Putative polysaccharide export protein [Desulfonema limicola]
MIIKKGLYLLCLCLILLFASCSYFHSDAEYHDNSVLKNSEEYRIGKGDVLEIITWKEPEFSRDIAVRIDGRISFPLLDDIQAQGRTCSEIKNEIQEKLKEFINHPVVSVSVKVPGSQKFYIIGEVLKPGEYPLAKKITLLQAFAISGGFSEWASKNDIILIRNEEGIDNIIRINYSDIVKGRQLDLNLGIKADDIIVVP